MHEARDLLDAALEHAQGRRIGQHDPGGLRAEGLAQGLKVDVAVVQRGDLADLVAAHDRGGGVGPVRGVGDEDLPPGAVAARVVVGADHRHPGELALRARRRRQRHRLHAGDVLEHLLPFVQAGQHTLGDDFRDFSAAGYDQGLHALGNLFAVPPAAVLQ